MKKTEEALIFALTFFIAALICGVAIAVNIKSDKFDAYKNLSTKLIIKSRAEKLTESEFIQLSDSDKLTVLNNYK